VFKAKRLAVIIGLFLFMVVMGSCGGGDGGGSNSGGGSIGETARKFTLTVDKFGEGVVRSDISGIDCGNDCSESYPLGTTVTLTAQDLVAAPAAEDGYSFKTWAGCDSVNGTTCTVTMDGDKVVFPTFGREVVLQGETKILDENAMQHLISREGSIFYFDPDIESVVVLQVGDVIMGRVIGGSGFLRKITKIYTAAGKLVVETEFANIPDAVVQGTLSFSKKLTHSDLAASRTISGVSLQRSESPDSNVFTFDVNTQVGQNGVGPAEGIEINESFGIVKIQGTVSLTFEVESALDKCWCLPPIEDFRTVLIVTQDNDLDISASEGAEVDGTILLGKLVFPVSLSGVPATLEVEIFLGVNGEIEVTASAGARLTNELTAGVRYRKDNGWSPVSGYKRAFTVKPVELGGSVSVKAYVKPEASLLIAGLVGPYMNLEAYLTLKGEASSTALVWGLYYGLDSHAGVKGIEIFGSDMPTYSVDLLDPNPEWELASDTVTIRNTSPTAAITSPSDGHSYTQGQSITFSGSGYDAEDGTLSGGSLVWTSSIDGQIGTGTSFTKSNLSVGTHTITLTATDSDGKSGNASINITLTAATALSITTSSLPDGTVNVLYGTNLSATGGKEPYRWSVANGSLPPDLSLSTGGIISGTLTTAGTYTFTAKVTDSSSPQQEAQATFTIAVNPSNTPTVTSVTPVSGTQGQTLDVTIEGTNLTGSTSVGFGSGITVNNFTVNSSTQITATISISSTATTGVRNVSVTTSAGTATGSGLFTVLSITGGVLSVTPSDRLDSSGTEGGPFSPSSKTFTISNTGGVSINWTSSKTQNWVSLSQTSGILAPGKSTIVTVTINSNANSLAPNTYVDIVTFTNTTNGDGDTTRTVNLTVNYSTPTITIGPTSLNFGDVQVGTCSTAVFAIQHVLGTGLASGSVSANPNPPFSITSGSSFSVSDGSAANVTVQFCPTSAGTFTGTAVVSSSATFTGTDTVTLTGTGFNPTPTTGTIQVNATLNGSSWSGTVNYTLTGPGTLNGTSAPANFSSQPAGTWTLTYSSGGPTGAVLSSISPSTSQTLSGGGSITFTLNFSSAPVERITNGSFDSGMAGWVLQGSDFWAGTELTNYNTPPGYAAGGVDYTGAPKNNADGAIYQTVTIPSNATYATLSFWYNITSDEPESVAYDYLYVTIRDSTGNFLANVATLSNTDKGTLGVYSQKTFDMTPYIGQTIRVRFGATTDSGYYTVFRIDDVSLISDGD